GLVTGIVGRNITFVQAAKTTNIETAYALLRASEIFERRFVFPMSGAVLVLGLITAWSASWPLLGFLQGMATNWLLLSLILTVAMGAAAPIMLGPRRRIRLKLLEDAHAQGTLTPALTAALNDPFLLRFRYLEFGGVLIVIGLMVLKPF
ncbi:MAG: DUF2269 family protein, partial [Chloroflexi bacterium]|nr:DUF2269 family protein [Chloroflexota bacterium]